MIQDTIRAILSKFSVDLAAAGWGMACNNFGSERDGKVLTNPEKGTSERAYIGIEDNRGTYLYFRENSGAVQLRSASLGSCLTGQIVTAQLRVVAVSNNLQNTAQILADKLFVDFSRLAVSNRDFSGISGVSLEPNTIWTNHAEIMLAETGGLRADAPRLSLAAMDFVLTFTANNCQLPTIKIC